jgi:pimeloyl-ACP methyl ester carboxylesterase
MRLIREFTSALAVILLTAAAAAQAPTGPAGGTASFTIFAGATPIGTEETTVTRIADGWRVSSTGSQRAPAPLLINGFDLTLAADWHPRSLTIDAVLGSQPIASTTTFGVTTAVTDYVQNGQKASVTHQISSRTIVLPNAFYAPYEVLAARLGSMPAGTTFRIFVVPQTEIDAVVTSVADQNVVTTSGSIAIRRYTLTMTNPGGDLPVMVDVDARGRLARVLIPSLQLSVVRDDLSSVSARAETYRNPGDEDVYVPALGFNLASTITKPAGGPPKAPAVVLIAGSGPADRDETVAGIPIFGQLAGQLAEAGYLVLRYDKRGVGQSGGRPEAATLSDYADDARAAVRWLARRKDVDSGRIALVGHSEGAAVALLVAARENKVKAVVLVAGPGTTGYDLVLEQQRHALDRMALDPADREARVAMQRRIMDAVVSGSGWDGVPPQLRAAADSPWFRSLLLFDPAEAVKKVKQPLLVVRAERDTQVPMHHGDRLAALANQRRRAPLTQLVTLDGVNHLLVPAPTGEVGEYPSLAGARVTPQLGLAVATFLNRAFALR